MVVEFLDIFYAAVAPVRSLDLISA